MKKYLSPLMLFGAALIWGCAFSAQKAISGLEPYAVGFWRSVLAAAFLFPVIALFDHFTHSGRKPISRRGLDFTRTEVIGGVACGLVLGVAIALQQFGISGGTDAGKASFITALYVVMVPVFGLLFGQNTRLNVWISVAIAIIGFYLLCIKGGFTMEHSDSLILISSVIFAAHILIIGYFSPRADGIRMSFIQFVVCAVVNLIPSLIFESTTFTMSLVGQNIFPLVVIGVGSSGVGYTLQILGQRTAEDTAAATIILSTESVIGAIIAAIAFGERMDAREGIGCAIIFCAVLLSQLDPVGAIKKRRGAKSGAENEKNPPASGTDSDKE